MKAKWKKIGVLLLIAMMLVSILGACSGGNNSTNDTAGTEAEETADTEEATEEESAETEEPTDAASKDTIVVATSAEPTSLDPQFGEDTTTQRVVMQISDTLIGVDENMNYVPKLAESWEMSPDGLTLTFKLREGVKAHNGETLTSEDVAYTVERGQASTLVAKAFAAIESVECPDDLTVVMHLAYSSPIQLAYLSSPSTGIVNKKACEEMGDESFGRAPVAYGPYKVVGWESGDKVTLEAHEDYWNGAPAIKNAEFKVYADSNTAAIALQNGQVDVVMDVSTADVNSLESDSNVAVYTGDSLIAFHLHMNCERTPFSDPKVRQAINYAINTQDIIDACFDGIGATIMDSFIPKMSLSADFGERPYQYDMEKAKSLLAEAGYENGFECNILVTSGAQEKMAQVIQAYLQQIGITLKIDVYEWGTLLDIVNSGDYDMTILRIVAMIPDPDLSLYTRFQSEQPYNFSKFKVPELDKMLEDARSCADADERTQMYLDINKYLWDNAPTVPLCFTTVINATNASLKGYHTDPRGFINVCELSW